MEEQYTGSLLGCTENDSPSEIIERCGYCLEFLQDAITSMTVASGGHDLNETNICGYYAIMGGIRDALNVAARMAAEQRKVRAA